MTPAPRPTWGVHETPACTFFVRDGHVLDRPLTPQELRRLGFDAAADARAEMGRV